MQQFLSQDPFLLAADLQEALRQMVILAEKYRQNPHYRLSLADHEACKNLARALRKMAEAVEHIGVHPLAFRGRIS